jgi:hypothetical protein
VLRIFFSKKCMMGTSYLSAAGGWSEVRWVLLVGGTKFSTGVCVPV